MSAAIRPKYLREHRELALDWAPEKAAGLLRISPGYLRNIENGYDQPSDRVAGRIARVYGLPLDTVLSCVRGVRP